MRFDSAFFAEVGVVEAGRRRGGGSKSDGRSKRCDVGFDGFNIHYTDYLGKKRKRSCVECRGFEERFESGLTERRHDNLGFFCFARPIELKFVNKNMRISCK